MEVIKRFGDKVFAATFLPPSPVLTEGAMIIYAPKWIGLHRRNRLLQHYRPKAEVASSQIAKTIPEYS